jgi:hypothetical protein
VGLFIIVNPGFMGGMNDGMVVFMLGLFKNPPVVIDANCCGEMNEIGTGSACK